MWTLLAKQYFYSRSVILAHALLLLLGVLAIFNGKAYLTARTSQLEQLHHFHEEHSSKLIEFNRKDLGSLMYYYRFGLVNPPQSITGLNIGQRQSQSDIQYLTIRGLQSQLYDTDFENPFNAAAGYFDLGFVILFLVPLLIIVNCFSLYAEEKELGAWRMIKVYSRSPHILVFKKWLIRLLSTAFFLFVLICLAVVVLNLSVNKAVLGFAGIAFLYSLWWYLFGLWIASFQRSGATTAGILLTSWLAFVILLPSGLNTFLESKFPIPEAYETALKQRDGYHQKWDLPKEQTMNAFYSKHPEYRKFPLPDKTFSWLWYYAMWQVGDDEAATEAKAIREKLDMRINWQNHVNVFFPSLMVQTEMDRISVADLDQYLRFLDKTTAFHEARKKLFYTKIFEEQQVDAINWAAFQPEHVSPTPFRFESTPFIGLTVHLLLLMLAIFCTIKFRKDA